MATTIKEICSFQSGGTPSKANPAYFGGNIPWITTVALNGRSIGAEDAVDWITEEAIQESAAKIVPMGSIMVGTRVGVGKVAINKVPMSTSQDIISLVGIDSERWDTEFLCRFIQSKSVFLNTQARGATIKGIKIESLAGLELPEVSLQQQHEIVLILNAVTDVIKARQRQISTLDTLIKARFVEMFGDPIIHLDRGETTQLDTIAKRITVGYVGEASNDYAEVGIPYLRTQNVRINHIDLNGLIYVNKSFHKKNSKSIIHPEDIVISRVGSNRGMAAVIPETLPEANIANCLIVGKTAGINSYYLAFYLNMSYGKRPQFGASVGSAQGVVNTAVLKKWEVYVPDKMSQDEFVEFAKQVDKSKVTVQKSLENAQLLLDSLMQKYFG